MLIGDSSAPDPLSLAIFGPTLRVNIGLDDKFDPDHPIVLPQPRITDVLALLDTGASENHIDDQLAAHLELPVIDETPISGVSGSKIFNVYLAQVVIRFPKQATVVLGSFYGASLSESGFSQRVLLGRRFLRDFEFSYNGVTGKVMLDQVRTEN